MRNLLNTTNSSAPNCLSEVTGPENNSKAKMKARTSSHSAKMLLRLRSWSMETGAATRP